MAGKARSVLVVDDDVELLGMVQILLEEAGYRVITAIDGQDGLEKVAQEMPAVISRAPPTRYPACLWPLPRPSCRGPTGDSTPGPP